MTMQNYSVKTQLHIKKHISTSRLSVSLEKRLAETRTQRRAF